ncbi:MAG: TolC family protein [Myxococcales bacterium]|nr:TolC family protein [Myxococcales bacterium]
MSVGLRNVALPVALVAGASLALFATRADAEPLQLTLLDAAQRALTASTDIRVARIEVKDATLTTSAELAAFYPTLGASGGVRTEKIATPLPYVDPRGVYSMTTARYAAGLSGLLPIGLRYELGLDSQIVWTGQNATSLSPQHINSLSLTLTQPLLRDNWSNSQSKLVAARVDSKQSLARARAKVSDVLLEVARAYWSLAAAQQHREIAVRSVSLARSQYRATSIKVRLGKIGRSELIEAQAAIAARIKERVKSEQALVDAERKLLTLIYCQRGQRGSLDLTRRLLASERPKTRSESRSLSELISLALRDHAELRAARLAVRSQRVRADAASVASRPKIDLVLKGGATSLAGIDTLGQPGHDRVQTPANPQVIGGHGAAWGQVFSFKQPFVELALRVELPLSSAARESEARRAALRLRRTLFERDGVAARVAIGVRSAFLKLYKAQLAGQAAQSGMELARQNLGAARKKFRVGVSTAYDVLRVQMQLAEAERDLVNAHRDAAIARAELERSIGALPSFLGVQVR